MKKIEVKKSDKKLQGCISLTTSKSESNRVLIIKSLCKKSFHIENLAIAKDTATLESILDSNEDFWDVGPAGTTMRFLTAYAAIQEGREVTLTGSQRMKERPIGILVDALKSLGADIEYLENNGFPPIKVKGKDLSGGEVIIDGSVSSQYISALLLIAPTLSNGMTLTFQGRIASKPYVEMTMRLIRKFGIISNWKDEKTIVVFPGSYEANNHKVEADWSAASYWYEIAAFCDEVDFKIMGLSEGSLQADSKVVRLYEKLGIKTLFIKGGIHLTKSNNKIEGGEIDFEDYPDIAQTLACSFVGLKLSGEFHGLESLRIKETDRIEALKQELSKIGGNIIVEGDVIKIFENSRFKSASIETYEDHRMAMAFAPLCMITERIVIEDPEVVVKSYPNYWRDLEKAGFEIKQIN